MAPQPGVMFVRSRQWTRGGWGGGGGGGGLIGRCGLEFDTMHSISTIRMLGTAATIALNQAVSTCNIHWKHSTRAA
ncbi:unnamed protein product [Jaminaea pallidilutea]